MSEHSHAHMHEHGQPHSHDPGHSHDHHHDGDTYFTDQLCMVGLSGAFGTICLCLWFWQTDMLNNMLAKQFHLYVLLSGIALVVIAVTRAGVLWRQSRDPKFVTAHDHHHGHDHDHHHDHGHEHDHTAKGGLPHVHSEACSHEHAPGQTCDHEHAHDHGHGHAHSHAHADHDEADHDHGWAPWRYVVILVPVILFLLGLPSKSVNIGASSHEQLIGDFTAIIYEALPFIVLGVLIAGLLEEFVPQQAIAKIVPRNHVFAIAIGGLLGLVFPMCECGIIVVMKRLLRKGLPLSVCVAYMLAGPVINVVVMTSTYVAFSGYNEPGQNDILGGTWFVVGFRVGLSYLIACVTAIVVDWQWRRHGNSLLHPSVRRGLKRPAADADNGNGSRSWGERINNITQTALHDFVDILAFLVLGAILAAGGKFVIKESNLQQFLQDTPALAILMMMGIAVLFCLCSEADAFVAANFPLFWPDGSKLAFLVLGPMLDLKLILMYTRVFRGKLILTIAACLVVQVFAYTMVVEQLFGRKHPPEIPPVTLPPNVETYLLGIGLGPDPASQLVHFGYAYRPSGKGEAVPYKQVYEFSDRPDLRALWKEKTVEVRGQYEPTSDQFFYLTRFKINCCSSDATAVRLPVVVRESLKGLQKGDWVKVTGRVEFRETGRGSFVTLLVVSKASDVEPSNPDTNPYVQ